MSSPNFVGPPPANRAVGRCEATDAIPTGTRRRRPIPRRSGRISARLCVCECMCVCAAVQVAPILRIPPRKPCDLTGASPTPRTRRPHAVSTWRGTRNGTSLPRAQKYPSNLAHSDGKPRVRLRSHATRAQSGLCRPIRVSLRACQLHLPCAIHTGCTRPAGSSRLASGKPPPVAYVRALPW